MELHTIRGGRREILENRGYTIGVGISIGNKWFNPDNIFELIKWILDWSKDKVVVYVADSIHAINISVRSRRNMDAARKLALKAGDEIFDSVKDKIKELSPEQINRILFVKWDEIIDDNYNRKLEYLRGLYSNNSLFKEAIHRIVMSHISKETRQFSDGDIDALGLYIIEELPECINRVKMRGIVVDAYVYPFDGELTKFIEQIQNGEIFPEIRENIMDTDPKVFLEVR